MALQSRTCKHYRLATYSRIGGGGGVSEKIYWHELTDEQRLDIWDNSGLTVVEFMKKYSQPEWCEYPDALQPMMGCWSLIMLPIQAKTKAYCKNCEYFKGEPCVNV